jgi:hypothetical protein
MPYASCSAEYQPVPRPSSTRPPDMSLTFATWMAENARVPIGGRADQGAEAHAFGVTGECCQARPGV